MKALTSAPANMFDREHAAAMKVEQLLETASRLFNERGLDGASLDQIAAALGATKGALYHYFADKRELILRCYERSAALDEKMTDLAERSGTTGLERGMIGLHLNVQAQVAGPSPLVPLIGFESIAPGPRKALQSRLAQLHRAVHRNGPRKESPTAAIAAATSMRSRSRAPACSAGSRNGCQRAPPRAAGKSPTRWSTCRDWG